MQIASGIDVFLSEPSQFRGRRLGLLMNQASVTQTLELACDAMQRCLPGSIHAIFSPQHGIWGEQQANMIETGHGRHTELDVPVYSLYSETRAPTEEMLDKIDVLVIDLQDVGTRVYTFIWTMLECLKACARQGVQVVVLDRVNPIGGAIAEGPLLENGYTSFVGGASIPLRHGLTMGELAQYFCALFGIDVELEIVQIKGWSRELLFSDTGKPWVWPSPNMPTSTTALLYPGMVLLEGAGLSEGRGTTRPFEVVGAPYCDPNAWVRELRSVQLPGLTIRPTRFVPTFDKWQGHSCGGLDVCVNDSSLLRSVRLSVAVLTVASKLCSEDFEWLPPPYEYEREKPPIDILWGSPKLREALSAVGDVAETVESLCRFDADSWWNLVDRFLLYR